MSSGLTINNEVSFWIKFGHLWTYTTNQRKLERTSKQRILKQWLNHKVWYRQNTIFTFNLFGTSWQPSKCHFSLPNQKSEFSRYKRFFVWMWLKQDVCQNRNVWWNLVSAYPHGTTAWAFLHKCSCMCLCNYILF